MSSFGPDQPSGSGHEGESGGFDQEFSIARSNALIPLLVLFGVTVLGILVLIVRAKPIIGPVGAPANKAFGPADFPAVFGKDEALAGIKGGPGQVTGDSTSPDMLFPVSSPPFTEGIFPCSNCHADIPPNPERRPLEGMHSDIVFTHDAEHRWCLDCHDEKNRDQLRLASGAPVPFTESYRLCGQCHGTQYRDWREGIHGKRTGYWNGPKRYLLCVNCHNPHSPRFAPLKPLPPPIRPQFLRPEEASADGQRSAAVAQKEDGDAGDAD